jgi:biopolymer transport protein TolQ
MDTANAADPASGQAGGFSLLALILHAGPVVQIVLLLLVLASIGVWAVLFDKMIRLSRLTAQMRRLDALSRNAGLAEPGEGLCDAIIQAGREALRVSDHHDSRAERCEQLREAMRLALNDGLRGVELGLPYLATVGSAAPFIGLFGTVWGIMASFTNIAALNDTSLAAVAPGLVEALFSTAMGLAAAIPAVIAYNKSVTALARARALGLGAIARLSATMSRQSAVTRREAAE